MSLGLGLGLGLSAIAGAVAALFRAGAVGWAHWYSLNDRGGPYLYQESAGINPVTAVGQSVGLVLDRAYNGARGVEILPSLNLQSGWTGAGTATPTGATTFTSGAGGGGMTSPNILTVGKTYQITVTFTRTSSGADFRVVNAGSASTPIVGAASSAASGTITGIFVAADARVYLRESVTGTAVTITSISIREIPGVHRVQATSASRPVLSARVNALIASEDMSNAAWSKTRSSASTGVTAPDGSSTAWKITEDSTAANTHVLSQAYTKPAAVSTQHRFDVWMQANGRSYCVMQFQDGVNSCTARLNLATGSLVSTATGGSGWSIQSATVVDTGPSGWYRWRFDFTSGATNTTVLTIFYLSTDGVIVSYNGDGVSAINIWHPDLRTADDAAKNIPAYQRTGASADTDHDTAGFPFYLKYDGTDDWYSSAANVPAPGSDKVTLVTGVSKLSDVLVQHLLGYNTTGADGSFAVLMPPNGGLARVGAETRGTTQRVFGGSQNLPYPHPAPLSMVFTMQTDHAGAVAAQQITFRLNGAGMPTAYDVPGPTGAGPYVSAPVYWGIRSDGILRFSGREYASIGRFGPMSDGERAQLEAWTKNLMRMP